jgi:hypothetical protein
MEESPHQKIKEIAMTMLITDFTHNLTRESRKPRLTTIGPKAAKLSLLLTALLGVAHQSSADDKTAASSHTLQHGFVLSADDDFASHLVAPGHHSHQAEISGQLEIEDQREFEIYRELKARSAGTTYFLLQAQNLDLLSLKDGQELKGHIIESKIGDYEPANKVVHLARFKINKVLLNIPNPFFMEDAQAHSLKTSAPLSSPSDRDSESLATSFKSTAKHCCDTGKKPCNWKC